MHHTQPVLELVRQFRSPCPHARPARKATEAVAVVLCWFGIVFVVRWEGVEGSVVSCVFDGGHVFAESVAVDVMRTSAGHQVLCNVVNGDGVLVGCGVLVALVGDVDESESITAALPDR